MDRSPRLGRVVNPFRPYRGDQELDNNSSMTSTDRVDTDNSWTTVSDPFRRSTRINPSQTPTDCNTTMTTNRFQDLSTTTDTENLTPTGNKRKKTATSPELREEHRDHDLLTTILERLHDGLKKEFRRKAQESHKNFGDRITAALVPLLADFNVLSDSILDRENTQKTLIRTLDEKNQLLEDKIEYLTEKLAAAEARGQNSDLANICTIAGSSSHTITKPRPRRWETSTIRIANKTVKETEEIVKQKLKPHQKDVRAVVTVVGQNIRVACEGSAAMDQIKRVMRDDDTLITDRKLLKPQVKVVGFENYDPSAKFMIEYLNHLNADVLGSDSKIVTTFKNARDNKRTDIVIEVTGDVQRKLLDRGSLLHGFSNHRVHEHLQIRQCVQCLGIGHKKDRCPSCPKCLTVGCKAATCKNAPRSLCFRCGGNHMRKDCTAATPKCSVCLHHGRIIVGKDTKQNAGHQMLGRECPMREQGERAMRARTDYG